MCIPTVQLSSPAVREPENGLLCGLSGSFRLKFLYVFDFLYHDDEGWGFGYPDNLFP
jgi:hypothetical protein